MPSHKIKKLQYIRISIGSANVLGLNSIKTEVLPTTCYIMTWSKKKCIGHCQFCPQSQVSDPKRANQLSRIQWPKYEWQKVLKKIQETHQLGQKSQFKRICLQVLNYPGFFRDVRFIISELSREVPHIPISTAIPPISAKKMQILKKMGLNTINFALDACTEELFDQIKGKIIHGPYSWSKHWSHLHEAIEIFGKNSVSTHLIVGLGESDKDMILCIMNIIEEGIQPGLFFFAPIKGTPMQDHPRPPLLKFRRIQLARFLLLQTLSNYSRFKFTSKGVLKKIENLTSNELTNLIDQSIPFETAGCPNCNRPFYTASPGNEQDGYPRPLTEQEKLRIYNELSFLIAK